MVRRQRSRFEFHVSSSMCAPLGCVYAWCVAHARHSRASLRNGPRSLKEDPLQFAFSSTFRDESCAAPSQLLDRRRSGHIHPRQHASKHRCDRRPQGKQIACAVAPPLTDTLAGCGPPRARPHHRFSTVEDRSRLHPRQHASKHRCDRRPQDAKVSKSPAPSHHRSPTLSQAVGRYGHGHVTVSRQSKIGPVTNPRQHASKHRCDRRRQGKQIACAVAPPLTDTLAAPELVLLVRESVASTT